MWCIDFIINFEIKLLIQEKTFCGELILVIFDIQENKIICNLPKMGITISQGTCRMKMKMNEIVYLCIKKHGSKNVQIINYLYL